MSELTDLELTDEQKIDKEFKALLNDYLNSNHRKKVEIIERAFNFANEAHKGIKRRSGEPYILHPLAVARIVCRDIGLGSTSICAALLHDVVEDTDYTEEDIENLFGKKIAQIVSGLTKISGGIFGDKASAQAENFRKLLLTMPEDIRVILIKIADRLHNMRTLGSMLPSKQYKIAGETLYIYAPLAHRLGLFAIKTELEDLSFKYEHPDAYADINQKIIDSEEDRTKLFEIFAQPIKKQLEAMGLDFEIKARVKSVYSIWNKMQVKNIPFEEVYDLFAVRIIFKPKDYKDEKTDCWKIYSIITDIYKLHPERIRDWVSRPKANGYQALHVTVMGPDGNWIEVQIRSDKMDDIAERGFAAHWKYKVGETDEESELDKWLKTIKEILENPEPNALDFLDTIKLNLFASEIFVFTPKGDLKTLPKNATALDFAFSLHTNIGLQAIAAKVNHKLVPLSQPLQSGDQVEILTSKNQSPNHDALNYVNTAKAKTKIIGYLRKEKRINIQKGEKLLNHFFEKNQIEASQVVIDKLLSHFCLKKREELFSKVGNGEIELDENTKKLIKEKNGNVLLKYWKMSFGKKDDSQNQKKENPAHIINRKETYILREVNGKKNYTIAACCKPIPGDDVLGYINDNESVVVHKRSCPLATKLKSSFGPRIISAQWAGDNEKSFSATIEIKGIDSVGVLNHITQVITGNLAVNIRNLHIDTSDGIFQGKIGVFVHDVNEVENLCHSLKQINEVKSANRINQ
ncbi:MAG: RelA/SpoT family protein [Bacteroidales bacterium]|nr:RelA/SpoT family protein [Bacteroidales bacterium]